MLSFPSLKKGLEWAANLGFKSEVLTSGTWFRHNPRFLDEISVINDVSLRVSVDAEHQKKVPVEELVRLLRRADQLNIETNLTLREIPGEPDAVSGTLAALEKALPQFMARNKDLSRFCHRIPHMPVCDPRRAASTNRPSSHGSKKWQKPCTLAFRDLVVGEDGLVYPCCGVIGLEKRREFVIGDPITSTWKELLRFRDQHPLLSRLRSDGPYRLAVAHGLTPEEWGIPFTSPCHLCLTLLNYFPDVL